MKTKTMICLLPATIALTIGLPGITSGAPVEKPPITITASPGLPAVELIRNGGFEEPYTSRQVFPDEWRSWGSLGRPAKTWRDNGTFHGGEAGLRMQTVTNAGSQRLYQRINGNQFAPGKTYHLSFWGRTEGAGGGILEVLKMERDVRLPVAAQKFTTADWKQFSLEFKMPATRTDILVFVGPADNKSDSTIWIDDLSILPPKTDLSYMVSLSGLRGVKLLDEKGEVLQDSGPLDDIMDMYTHSATVPVQGRYRVEATDAQGKTVVKEIPEGNKLDAADIVINGDFEEPVAPAGPALPRNWEKWSSLGMPAKPALDTNEFKSGKQSFRMAATGLGGQAIIQPLPVAAWQPNQVYICTFWGKTDPRGTGEVHIENSERETLGVCRFSSEDWKPYNFTFTTPPTREVIYLWLYLTSGKIENTVVWWDQVTVRPLYAAERALHGRVSGIVNDMNDAYRSVVRSGYYDVETKIDLLEFDAGDLGAFRILDDDAVRALEQKLEALRRQLKDVMDRMTSNKDQAIAKLDGSILLADVSNGEATIQGLGDWRERWTRTAASDFGGIDKAAINLRVELAPQLEKLAQAKSAADRDISAREAAAFPDDFKPAMSQVKSDDPATRERAALELGRLENPDAVPALIELLRDPAYPVRRNALYALAWIRAEQALPEITALAEKGGDEWTRRRATQALGMIGSPAAGPALLKLIEDKDGAVRQNAMLGLGWLRETNAVSALTNVVSRLIKDFKTDTNAPPWLGMVVNGPQHEAGAAIVALGLIGDKSVVPLLTDVMKANENVTSLSATFALGRLGDTNVAVALEEQTKHEKRRPRESINALYLLNHPLPAEPLGIVQPGCLKEKRYFYWFGSRFHRGFGRCLGTNEGNRPRTAAEVVRVMGAAHATEIIEWIVPSPLDEAGHYFDAAASNNLRAVTAYNGLQGPFSKANLARMFDHYGQYPAFNALWGEEGGMEVLLEDVRDYLPRYVAGRYSPEEREQLGLQSDRMAGFIERDLRFVDPDKRRQERPGFAVYAEAMDANLFDGSRELVEFLHMLRKNMAIGHYSTIAANTFAVFVNLASFGRMAHIFDYNGTEPSYNTVTYENAYLLEMCRDGQRYPTGTETYIWRLPRELTRLWESGIGLSLLHSQQMYVWYWGDIYKQLNDRGRGRPEAWSITTNMFAKIEKIEPYLVNPGFPGDIAIIHSGRTAGVLYRDDERDRLKKETFQPGAYFYNNAGIFQALAYEHVQADIIWADTMTPDKIAGYKVLVLADAKTLAPTEEDILRQWVKAGGTLIATGSATAFDQYGRERANYGLADVFGVNFRTNSNAVALENLDSGNEAAPPKSGRFVIKTPEIDPVASKWLAKDLAVDYTVTAGYDRVTPGTAQVLGTWENGQEPALTLNRFGKGHCFFLAATYPGRMYVTERFIYRWALMKKYHAGIRELLAGLTRSGLELAGGAPAFEVVNCPHHVEAHVKTQPEKNRLILQLLNYDERVMPIANVTARLRAPEEGKIRLFYPADNQAIDFRREGAYVVFQVRPFEIHEAVVLEWE
ncbi:MAG: HEAT repeat domain-containing protein [Kiritimatiellae bacterium]|nr:HEAT repeat domain-containing protein [Kiritimatiellia bacterium]